MATQVTDDRAGALEGTAAMFGMSPDEVAEVPMLLMGSPSEIADTLRARRERWGFSHITVQGLDTIEAFAPVSAAYAAVTARSGEIACSAT